jgi:hypothetical protein
MANQNWVKDFEEKTKDLNIPRELFINVVAVDGYLQDDDRRKRLGA